MIHYDAPDFARRYALGRRMSQGAARVWMNAIRSAIGESEIRSVVDVGCGTGRFLEPLSESFSCGIVGIDRSLPMLREAQRDTDDRMRLVCCDAARIPICDGAFDPAFISMAYHHFRAPEVVVREMRRTLQQRCFLCLRNSTRDAFEGISYLRFFPSALVYNRNKLVGRERDLARHRADRFVRLRERRRGVGGPDRGLPPGPSHNPCVGLSIPIRCSESYWR